MAKRGPKGPLSDAHKAALAQGREEGRIVRLYLEALRANAPKRGRKRTIEAVRARLEAITELLSDEELDVIKRLRSMKERRDLELEQLELEAAANSIDLTELETAFIEVAKSYSARHGIVYASWRDVGVPAEVLRRAGITRSS